MDPATGSLLPSRIMHILISTKIMEALLDCCCNIGNFHDPGCIGNQKAKWEVQPSKSIYRQQVFDASPWMMSTSTLTTWLRYQRPISPSQCLFCIRPILFFLTLWLISIHSCQIGMWRVPRTTTTWSCRKLTNPDGEQVFQVPSM